MRADNTGKGEEIAAASSESGAVQHAAVAYVRQRGFSTSSGHSREVKINEMLSRDSGKPSQYALHVPVTAGRGYEESYAKLGAWIRGRPPEQLRELNLLRFPMFVHCFLAMLVQSCSEGREAPTRFLELHAGEHRQGSNVEKRRQVEQLIQLAKPATNLGDSPIAKLYLTQRVSWVCSATSFEAVTTFLVDAKLHLLLRVFVLYFNVHAVRREPPPPTPAPAPECTDFTAVAKAKADALATPSSISWGEMTDDEVRPEGSTPTAVLLAADVDATMADAATSAAALADSSASAAGSSAGAPELSSGASSSAPANAEPPLADKAIAADAIKTCTDDGRTSRSGNGSKERRPCNASVCVLRFRPGGDASECSSIDLSSCMRLAACSRSDGAISLCRVSKEGMLESRFQATETTEPMSLTVSANALIGHTGPVHSCAFSRDSRFVLSAGQDGGVRLWAARHAKCIVSYRGHAHPVYHTDFSPHNAHFLTACYDGGVRIYTTERRTPLRVLAGHTADVNHATFHQNGAYALSASEDGTMRLWDVSTAGCIRLFAGHKGGVCCSAISPDGATAASASEDGSVRVWHLASGRMLCSLPLGLLELPNEKGSPRTVIYSSNGRLLACATANSVAVWEVRDLSPRTGEKSPKPTLNFDSGLPLMSASFVPNHAVLIAAGVDGLEK